MVEGCGSRGEVEGVGLGRKIRITRKNAYMCILMGANCSWRGSSDGSVFNRWGGGGVQHVATRFFALKEG